MLNITDGGVNSLTGTASTLFIGLENGESVSLTDSANWTVDPTTFSYDTNADGATESYTLYSQGTVNLYVENVTPPQLA